jgi:D-glutamate cyclase
MTDYIDQLVTVEMRNRAMPNGKVGPLYDAARAEGGGEPLVYRAAQGLINAVRPGDTVFTSAGSGPLIPKGENDGPVGGAVLALALQRGLGATPIMVCEWQHVDPIVAACEAIGVAIRDAGVAIRSKVGGALLAAPKEQDAFGSWAKDLLDRFTPSTIVAVERFGPNRSPGLADWDPLVDVAPLFTKAARRGIFSVGIGDAGNQIGFGRITDAVQEIQQPYGARCPCDDGMATVTPTDVLVVAAVSNWSAYGIEATLAILLERPDLLHTPAEARRMIESCLEAGGLEAIHCTRRFFVDDISGETSVNMVQMLNEMVRMYLERPATGAIH